MANRFHSEEPPSPNGQRPPLFDPDVPVTVPPLNAEILLALLMTHPHLQRALKRDPDTEPDRHSLYDAMLATAALSEDWEEGAIVALIHEGNTRNALPAPPVQLCRLIIHEAHLRSKTGDLDFAREKVLDQLSDTWGLQISEVIRHGTENALWHLRLLDGREIQLGSSEALLSQAKVRAKIFDVTGHIIPRYGPKDARLWDHHVEILALVARTIDTPEMTRVGQAKALLMGYLEQQDCQIERDNSSEEWGTLALNNRPFVRDGLVYISVRNFLLAHVRMVYPRMTQSELLDLLRLIGGKRTTVAIHGMTETSRSLWRLPVVTLIEAIPATLELAEDTSMVHTLHDT